MTIEWEARYDELFQYTAKHYEHVSEAAKNVQQAQAHILSRIIVANSTTPFGITYSFGDISSPLDFQRRVPCSRYDSYASWLERKDLGQFAHSPPTACAWSSGTEGARKCIPLPATLLGEFELAIAAWLHSLILRYPRITSGPAYWIVGPRFQTSSRNDDLENDDGSYFLPNFWERLAPLLVPSPVCGSEGGFTEWAFATLLYLILEPELTWMSVWSPTLLSELLESYTELRPFMEQSLRDGRCEHVDLPLASKTIESLNEALSSRREISAHQLAILKRAPASLWRELWPNLTLCSCWGDGWASLFLPRLMRQLPGVAIQKKGLLATEGVISLPFEGDDADDPVLAINSHFFEFVHPSRDVPLLAHQVELGGRYEVLLTTGGGLYRYALGDTVEVTGWFHEAPRIRFLGKTSGVTDMCGEKLHESFVVQCLEQLGKELSLDLSDITLRPVIDAETRYYEACTPDLDERQCEDVRLGLESQLALNPHYAQCRALRQLEHVRVTTTRCTRTSTHLLSTAKERVLLAGAGAPLE